MMRIVSVHPFDARVEVVDTPLGRALVCRPLAEVAPHLFTTRDVDLRSTEPGTSRQWHRLARILGVAPERLARAHQVHGRGVASVDADTAPWGDRLPAADALVTDDPTVAVSVRTADCVPILIADRRLRVVAAVHAGWRGTCASIAAATVEELRDRYGSNAHDLVAAIGPSAGPDRFEVGDDVVDAFREAGHDETRLTRWFVREFGPKPHADLWTANHDQLVAAGVLAGSVTVMGACTLTHSDWFFSHRGDGAATGRLAAAIRPPAA
jgi:YfiH family protein